MKKEDSLLVSISGDILLVGHKDPKKPVEIVNAFQGEEAHYIWALLTTKKESAK